MNAETRAANERARILKLIRHRHRQTAARNGRAEELSAQLQDAEQRARRTIPLHHHANDAF